MSELSPRAQALKTCLLAFNEHFEYVDGLDRFCGYIVDAPGFRDVNPVKIVDGLVVCALREYLPRACAAACRVELDHVHR